MVPLPGSTGGRRRLSRTFDSEKGGMTMLKMLLLSLALVAATIVVGGVRGMSDGGL